MIDPETLKFDFHQPPSIFDPDDQALITCEPKYILNNRYQNAFVHFIIVKWWFRDNYFGSEQGTFPDAFMNSLPFSRMIY